jgi:transposase-like protein
LRDIRAMLAVSGDESDRSALNEWVQRCGLQTEWRLVSENPGESGL